MRRALMVATALLALAGCGGGSTTAKAPLTEHQRDSVLAQEPLPGAGAVGGAMRASDRAADDAAKMNAAVDSLPR